MEISGAVLRGTAAVSSVLPIHDSLAGSVFTAAPPMAGFARRVRASGRIMGMSPSFSDTGHLKYYAPPVRCSGGKCKEEKKKAKVVKGLSKDLSALCSIGIGVGTSQGLAGEVKMKMITVILRLILKKKILFFFIFLKARSNFSFMFRRFEFFLCLMWCFLIKIRK